LEYDESMTRRRWVTLALALSAVASFACNPPPERPPLLGVELDAGSGTEDSAEPSSTPSCQALGGRCIEPGGPCPIQIAGKDPCGSAEGGVLSGQICCTGD
jgi:hypothetical protein